MKKYVYRNKLGRAQEKIKAYSSHRTGLMEESLTDAFSLFVPWGERFALVCECWIVSGLVTWEQSFSAEEAAERDAGKANWVKTAERLEAKPRDWDPAQSDLFYEAFLSPLPTPTPFSASRTNRSLSPGSFWHSLDFSWVALLCLLVHPPSSLQLELLESRMRSWPFLYHQHPSAAAQ